MQRRKFIQTGLMSLLAIGSGAVVGQSQIFDVFEPDALYEFTEGECIMGLYSNPAPELNHVYMNAFYMAANRARQEELWRTIQPIMHTATIVPLITIIHSESIEYFSDDYRWTNLGPSITMSGFYMQHPRSHDIFHWQNWYGGLPIRIHTNDSVTVTWDAKRKYANQNRRHPRIR